MKRLCSFVKDKCVLKAFWIFVYLIIDSGELKCDERNEYVCVSVCGGNDLTVGDCCVFSLIVVLCWKRLLLYDEMLFIVSFISCSGCLALALQQLMLVAVVSLLMKKTVA